MSGHNAGAGDRDDIERLVGVQVDVTVELGRTRMTLGQALDIGPGAVIPLDRTAGSPLALKVNGQLIARGEVVVIDDVYGLRIEEIVQPNRPARPTPAPPPAAEKPAEPGAEPKAEGGDAPAERIAA
jgi:flagellar motor switch protein FliN